MGLEIDKSMLSERDALIGLNMVSGLGCVRIRKLLKEFSSASKVWSLPYEDLCKIKNVGDSLAKSMALRRLSI